MITRLIKDVWAGKPAHLRSSKWPKVERYQLGLHPYCAVCGASQHLEVHHILPFHLFPEFELCYANLLTLCRIDHYLWGHGKDWKAYIPNVKNIIKTPDEIHESWVIRNRIYVRDETAAQLMKGLCK